MFFDLSQPVTQSERLSIIIVEQNVPMVFAMTDRFVILEKGRVVAAGSRAEISHSTVMQDYLAI